MEFVATRLTDNPLRATHELHAPLEGLRSGSVGPYRVLVDVDELTRTVDVLRVDYHATAYRVR